LITFQTVASGAMNFSYRLSGQYPHLDGANHFLGIARANSPRNFGIQARERPMKMF